MLQDVSARWCNEIKLILAKNQTVNEEAQADQVQALRSTTPRGMLFWDDPGEALDFLCFTMEDEHRR